VCTEAVANSDFVSHVCGSTGVFYDGTVVFFMPLKYSYQFFFIDLIMSLDACVLTAA